MTARSKYLFLLLLIASQAAGALDVVEIEKTNFKVGEFEASQKIQIVIHEPLALKLRGMSLGESWAVGAGTISNPTRVTIGLRTYALIPVDVLFKGRKRASDSITNCHGPAYAHVALDVETRALANRGIWLFPDCPSGFDHWIMLNTIATQVTGRLSLTGFSSVAAASDAAQKEDAVRELEAAKRHQDLLLRHAKDPHINPLPYLVKAGSSAPRDLTSNSGRWEMAAAEGDPEALFWMGWSHYAGSNGKDMNVALACRTYFAEAAKYNNPLARFYYAQCLHSGTGVTRNLKLALVLATQGRSFGNTERELLLGQIEYERAKSGSEDHMSASNAVYHLLTAAKRGDIDAMFLLAKLRLDRKLGQFDMPQGTHWLNEAARHGHPQALKILGQDGLIEAVQRERP